MDAIDDDQQIKSARQFLESRGLCVMDLRAAPHSVDMTSPEAPAAESSYIYNHKNKFEVGPDGQPIGYLPIRLVWLISAGMIIFGIGLANRF